MSSELQAGKVLSSRSGNAQDDGMALNARIEKAFSAIPSVISPCGIALVEWKKCTLADVALNGKDGLIDGPFGSALPADLYQPAGIPVIRGSNLSKGEVRFKGEEFVFVSEEVAARLVRATCIPEDIIFTKKGTLGQVGIIPLAKYPLYLLSSNQMRLRVNRDFVLPEFAYYYLSQKESIEKIIRDSEHTGVPKINLAYLRNFPIIVPPIREQFSIVAVLNALDDRIALLRETNATLEAMAQALFKSWFVDFDPVHANAGTQVATLPPELQFLFPTTFTETPQGLVPEGWEMGTLQDLLVLQRGFDLPASDRTEGLYPIIAASGPSGSHEKAMVKGPGVITGRSGVLGKVFFTLEDYWPLNTTLWIKEFKRATPCYALEVLNRLDMLSFNAGSAVPSLNRNHIHGLPYLLPPLELVNHFESVAMPIQQKMHANNQQAQTLATLRDTLLPRLISGQLRLPEAESALAEVV